MILSHQLKNLQCLPLHLEWNLISFLRTMRSHEIWPCFASLCPYMPGTLASVLIFDMDKLLLALDIFFLISLSPPCFCHNWYCARDRQEEDIRAWKEPKCQIPACSVSGLWPLPLPCPIHPVKQWSPVILASRTSFVEDSFSTDQGWGIGFILHIIGFILHIIGFILHIISMSHLLWTLFVLLLHCGI